MVNAAVVGYGAAGRYYHSYLIGLASGIDLYAIATRDPERRRQAAEHHSEARIYESIDQLISDDKYLKFNTLVRTAFSQRRKMLKNTLKGLGIHQDSCPHIDLNRRPETLTIEEFVSLI